MVPQERAGAGAALFLDGCKRRGAPLSPHCQQSESRIGHNT